MKEQIKQKPIASIRCAWPDFVTRATKKHKVATYSRLHREREVDFRPESKIAQSDKPFGGIRFQNKIQKMREDIASRKAARNRKLKMTA
jgi:hypothetical protein